MLWDPGRRRLLLLLPPRLLLRLRGARVVRRRRLDPGRAGRAAALGARRDQNRREVELQPGLRLHAEVVEELGHDLELELADRAARAPRRPRLRRPAVAPVPERPAAAVVAQDLGRLARDAREEGDDGRVRRAGDLQLVDGDGGVRDPRLGRRLRAGDLVRRLRLDDDLVAGRPRDAVGDGPSSSSSDSGGVSAA